VSEARRRHSSDRWSRKLPGCTRRRDLYNDPIEAAVKDASSSLPMTDLEGEFLQCESTIRPQGFTPDTKRLSYRPLHFAPLNSLSEGVARRVSRMVVRGAHEGPDLCRTPISWTRARSFAAHDLNVDAARPRGLGTDHGKAVA
jgi:hypothetical protein